MSKLFPSILLLLALVACQTAPMQRPALKQAAASRQVYTLLQANIGNVDPACSLQARSKLCHQDVEDRIAHRIQAIRPDLVSLQEVLPDWICRAGKAGAEGLACHQFQTRPVRDQIRRLLGPDYTIVCEPHQSWDCVGIRKALGRVLPDPQGHVCPPGALCGTERLSGGDPQAQNVDEGYTRYQAATIESPIDDGFHVMAVDLEIAGQPLRLINAHPQSGNKPAQQQARASQLDGLFTRLATPARVLIAGDLNADPFRQNDPGIAVFKRYADNYGPQGQLTAAKAFHFLSGPREQPPIWPPRPSAHYLWPLPSLTLDHVLSNFATGSCQTLEGPQHLSGGKGTDHSGQECKIVNS
ncbi:MAG: endonuclease/exonuclease/phosphatase family protein [Candidatus Sericytochromatia bacterium]